MTILIMPDFCSTGIWIAETDDLSDNTCVDRNDLIEDFTITEELELNLLNWIYDYESSLMEDYYTFKSKEDYDRVYNTGLNLAKEFKRQVPDIKIQYWIEDFDGEKDLIKMEV